MTAAVERCLVMGIVNRTPDSFFDGGRMGLGPAVEHALRLVAEGADVLDLGGVSAGPGAAVGEAEETDRLLPLVEALASEVAVPLSVETHRADVARAAIAAGARIVNDVTGLSDPDLAGVVAASEAKLVVMHHGGQIRGRPRNPRYDDVVVAVRGQLLAYADAAHAAGVPRDRIVVDAGLDFGKNTWHSLELVRRTHELTVLGYPLLVAASRKDVVGETLDLPPDQRLEGTLALVALSVLGGAAIVRVHDVRATVRTVRMVEAVMGRRPPAAPVRGLWE
ncbi:MAG: dihydropteroate synthase [Actinomycetota bacterium]|nr:dihydropteroate synthase [Actinomycetota bacterium]